MDFQKLKVQPTVSIHGLWVTHGPCLLSVTRICNLPIKPLRKLLNIKPMVGPMDHGPCLWIKTLSQPPVTTDN